MTPYEARKARSKMLGGSGRKAETKTSKRLGAKLTPASGASMRKGDMSLDKWRIESKSTLNAVLPVQLAWLRKISDEALMANCLPALSMTFVTTDGAPLACGAWIAVPENVFEVLIRNQGG